jgi:hypothetical protein
MKSQRAVEGKVDVVVPDVVVAEAGTTVAVAGREQQGPLLIAA